MLKRLALAIAISLSPLPTLAELRDPTLPGNLPLIAEPDGGLASPMPLTMTAIRIADSSRVAIVNGQTVKTGEWLNDEVRIIKIMPNYVIVNDHGDRKKLYLVPPIKK